MKIIFINMNKKAIDVYAESGLVSVPFKNVNALSQIVGTDTILYVTNAVSTNVNSVIGTVKNIMLSRGETIEITENIYEPPKEVMVIKATSKASLTIPDLKLVFSAPYDYYVIEDLEKRFGKDFIKESVVLRRMLDNKILEIAPRSKAEAFAKEWEKDIEKKESILGRLIVDRDKEDNEEHDIAVTIDLNESGPRRLNAQGLSNEGSLLPPDF